MRLLHWDGAAWSQISLPTAASVRDISGAGPGTVWVTTGPELSRCTVLGCETVSASVQVGDQTFLLMRLLSFSPDEVFALSNDLLCWQNGTWTSLYASDTLRFSIESHLAGSGPDDLWVSAYYAGRFPLGPHQALVHVGTAPGAALGRCTVDRGAHAPGNLHESRGQGGRRAVGGGR